MAELVLDHNDSGVGPYSYKWNTGDTSSTLITNIDGNYQATLTDGNGCTEVLTENVRLLPVLLNHWKALIMYVKVKGVSI